MTTTVVLFATQSREPLFSGEFYLLEKLTRIPAGLRGLGAGPKARPVCVQPGRQWYSLPAGVGNARYS